tara:strand:- start:2127 stop:2291 length:165 start_codon:yes stop_codon:yes gene_type:complete
MAKVDINYFIAWPDFCILACAKTTLEVSEFFDQVMEYYTFVLNCALNPMRGQLM